MSEQKKTDRATEVADSINAHLPESYRNEIRAEQLRLETEYLKPRSLETRRVLIVGGAGYVGSVMTDHFLRRGYAVRSFDNLLYQHGQTVVPFLSQSGYEFQNGDISNEADIEDALDGVTDVILLAGLVGDPITKKYPELSARVNDRGYEVILRCLVRRAINKVVFVSTCSNYGLIEGDQLADEEFELNPLSLYAKSKVRFEQELLAAGETADFTPTVLRFATAFGLSPRMRFDLTISEFTRAIALGEDLLVYDAHTWRPYCHLQDFAELARRVLEAPVERIRNQVFNAGGDANNFTKQMIVDAILAQVPDGKVRYKEHGGDPRNYRVDFAKVREALFFEPSFTVPDGIQELLGAIRRGLFVDIRTVPNFYGNYEI